MIIPREIIELGKVEPLELVVVEVVNAVAVIVEPRHSLIDMPDQHPRAGQEEIIFAIILILTGNR